MAVTVLITGANGQLGTVLCARLQREYGIERVIASDIHPAKQSNGRFQLLDVTDCDRLTELVRRERVTHIYHLAAILSAKGEAAPIHTWRVNMDALLNVLEVSRKEGVEQVFYPSSIAVFGNSADLVNTPNNSVLNPQTVYGISKAAGENWAQYYYDRYGLDVRSLRYPGVIGPDSKPGGGTTDYAVEIFYHAVQGQPFTCYLESDTTLPMIYMDDAIRATIELMQAPREKIKLRTSYNISGCCFSPAEIASEIRKSYPDFTVHYAPDFRQAIAAGWPGSIDDRCARTDWGWRPAYQLQDLVAAMLTKLANHRVAGPARDRHSPYLSAN